MSFVENKNIWSLAKIQASGNPWVLFWIDSVSFQLPPSIWMRWLVQGAPGPGLILITLFYPVFDPHAYRQMMDEAIWSRTHSSASNLVSFVKKLECRQNSSFWQSLGVRSDETTSRFMPRRAGRRPSHVRSDETTNRFMPRRAGRDPSHARYGEATVVKCNEVRAETHRM